MGDEQHFKDVYHVENDSSQEASENVGPLNTTSAEEAPAEQLISEEIFDEMADAGSIAESDELDKPFMHDLVDKWVSNGLKATLQKQFASSSRFEIHLELPAGRSTRTVIIEEDAAATVSDADLSGWRSLRRYDGVWNESGDVVEVALRGERVGMPSGMILRRLTGRSLSGSESAGEEELVVVDEETGLSLRISDGSVIAKALLSGRGGLRRSLITARLEGVFVSTTDEAEEIAQRIADSLSVDLHMTSGISLVPKRLESSEVHRSRTSRGHGRFAFPKNLYPHAPTLLYQAGRDRSTAPLIRYWSFYQVLEYFYPKYVEAEALRQLSRFLRSPTFDPHRDENILRTAQLAVNTGAAGGPEEEQLKTTLRSVVTADELRGFINANAALKNQLQDKRSELSARLVQLERGDDPIAQLGQRIYDIRCRIVHSKNGSARDAGPGLLPGTHHDDQVRVELPLMEFLAQQALVASAEPLRFAHRPIRAEKRDGAQ